MVNLNQLEVLVAVIESGGFSGAAKKLYMSQPSVSNHVRNLETSFGVQLVERTSQGARPTAAGVVVVEHAREVFLQLASLERELATFQGLDGGRLTVAGTTTLGTYLLPRLVAQFSARAPRVDCQIRVGNEEAVEGWIVRGEVALGLSIGAPREQLEAEPLLTEEMVLVAAADSPLVGRVLSASDLAGQRFLVRERGSATRRQQEEILQSWGLESAERWEMWGPDTLKEAAYAGLGIALLSEHATARERAVGDLVALVIDPAPPSRTVSLIRRAQLRAMASWPS